MKKSISRRIGMIIFFSLFVSLAIMIIVLLTLERNSKIASAKSDIHNLSQSISKSIVFAMSQGATDIHIFANNIKNLENLSELRVIPTDKIKQGEQAGMDNVEQRVISNKKSEFITEDFKNVPVSRIVEPILSDESCNSCHGSTTGEPLAVISIRYSRAKRNSDIARQSYIAILLALGSMLGTILLSVFFVKKEVIRDLAKSVFNIGRLAQGEVAELDVTERDDEIGELNASLKKLQQCMADRARIGDNISQGNFSDEIVLLSQEDKLGNSFRKITSNIKELINDAEKLSNSAIEGDLNYRIRQDKHNGEFGKIIAGINNTLDAVSAPVKEGVTALERMSNGDLTVSITSAYKGDHAIIKNSINSLAESLRFTMKEIKTATHATASSANEIASSSDQMAAGAQEQSQQTAEVAGAVEQLSATINNVTREAFVAADTLKNAREEAIEGGSIVKLTIDGMNRISEVVTDASKTVEHLGESSSQIGEIIQVIDDIADQTNLLALNAAIEAARAGEQGRGFAVVADEVRKLAERTIKATKEIAQMINKIQTDTDSAVNAIRNGKDEVERGKLYALKSGDALNRIIEDVNKSADITMQAVSSNEQMAQGADVISKNIEGITTQVQQAAAGTEQFARAAEDLNRLTMNLQNLLSQFHIGNENSDGNMKHAAKHSNSLLSVGKNR
ncbi:MAG: methyl-accepting chemotaxis protein [Syntrophothermus sp.]